MTKEQRSIVLEYASSLSDEEVRALAAIISENPTGDLSEALNFMSTNPNMDAVLASAESANQLWDLVEKTRDIILKESKRKTPVLKPQPVVA